MSLSLTELAAEKAKEAIVKDGTPGKSYLRLGIKGGGCSGYNYDLGLDDSPIGDNDLVFESFGVKLVTNEICMTYLEGTEIDYVEAALYGGGFKFNNPNAVRTCGCEMSFSVK